ncbi:unnamed protein product [Parnassius mnemosyne]|uniref:Tc1-like transposase DDE domain-containing protein n=1 Tax=Parnassius mnemosyne TaxID=213953 RepID=A0AAV1LCW7_9NEOP
MDPQPSTSSQSLSPRKKRPRIALSVTEKLMIQNVYKHVFEEKAASLLPIEAPEKKECVSKTADILGIGVTSVSSVLKECKENEQFKSPEKRGPKHSFKDKLDDFTFAAIRRKVHNFFYANESPTIIKILKVVNEDPDLPNFSWSTLRNVMKHLNFKYVTKSRHSILIDRQDIILWRQRYLRKIKEYRREGRYIYYQDETWINEGHAPKKAWIDQTVLSSRQAFLDGLTTGLKQPSGKGKRLIIGHIGGEEGFVEDSLLIFEAKKNIEDYHQEMNADSFEKWFRGVLPKLKPNSVVVMDNAPYHSRKLESLPKMSWTKPRILEWLTSKNISFEATMVKATLIDIVRQHKQEHCDKYVVDEMAAQHGIIVLRLPPYHCELNPIELVWAQAKGYVARNNKTFKMTEVKKLFEEGLQHITPEKWNSCVSHIIKKEDKMYGLDHMIDNVTDRFLINVTESDSDDFLSDNE